MAKEPTVVDAHAPNVRKRHASWTLLHDRIDRILILSVLTSPWSQFQLLQPFQAYIANLFIRVRRNCTDPAQKYHQWGAQARCRVR